VDAEEKVQSRGSELPFGAMTDEAQEGGKKARKDWRRPENRRGSKKRGGRRRRRGGGRPAGEASEKPAGESRPADDASPRGADAAGAAVDPSAPSGRKEGSRSSRRGRRRRGRSGRSDSSEAREESRKSSVDGEAVGMLFIEKRGGGVLRSAANDYLPHKRDVHVPQRTIQRLKLRNGSIVEGRVGPGQGKQKRILTDVTTVDGQPPKSWANAPVFKNLRSIDPDFHYALGDETGEVSLRILDLLCPVGRGTRGLIVAPPRSGKTILMQQFARGIEKVYPDVHLMVLLVDERPEEATEWRRNCGGQVFVSTNDEPAERHVKLAEVVWKRCQRLVEIGEDVVLLLDSITRLARAYNNTIGAGSGRTMSGGLDSRTMERPKQFFGSARNTEDAGSLTILGTTLVETGSRMDQVIFEEFKGTGNMELVLSRKLADRRIFPAIDVERSGTRKEEKLITSHRLRQINTLRRVLTRMHFVEAMELLITKLEDVERTDDFLKRFEIDPDL